MIDGLTPIEAVPFPGALRAKDAPAVQRAHVTEVVLAEGGEQSAKLELPGLVDFAMNRAAIEQCSVVQLSSKRDSQSGARYGARLVILRGQVEQRTRAIQALESAHRGGIILPEQVLRAVGSGVVGNAETPAPAFQAIVIEGSSGEPQVRMYQWGQASELNLIQTEFNGGNGWSYTQVQKKGLPEGTKSVQQGRVKTHLIVGGGSDVVDTLTGGAAVAVEGNEALGWLADTTVDGKFTLMAQIAMVDSGAQPVTVSGPERLRQFVEKAQSVVKPGVPVILIRDNTI